MIDLYLASWLIVLFPFDTASDRRCLLLLEGEEDDDEEEEVAMAREEDEDDILVTAVGDGRFYFMTSLCSLFWFFYLCTKVIFYVFF